MKLSIQMYTYINNKEVISQSYNIDRDILKSWLQTLRFGEGTQKTIIEVPNFESILEVKKFIVGINLLKEPISGHVPGPIDMFYSENGESKNLGKFSINLTTGEKIDINIKKYGLFDDLPEGNQKVETLLGDIDHFIAFITYNDNPSITLNILHKLRNEGILVLFAGNKNQYI